MFVSRNLGYISLELRNTVLKLKQRLSTIQFDIPHGFVNTNLQIYSDWVQNINSDKSEMSFWITIVLNLKHLWNTYTGLFAFAQSTCTIGQFSEKVFNPGRNFPVSSAITLATIVHSKLKFSLGFKIFLESGPTSIHVAFTCFLSSANIKDSVLMTLGSLSWPWGHRLTSTATEVHIATMFMSPMSWAETSVLKFSFPSVCCAASGTWSCPLAFPISHLQMSHLWKTRR